MYCLIQKQQCLSDITAERFRYDKGRTACVLIPISNTSNRALSAYIKVEATGENFRSIKYRIDFKHDQSYKLIGKGTLKINEVMAEKI